MRPKGGHFKVADGRQYEEKEKGSEEAGEDDGESGGDQVALAELQAGHQ